MCPGERNTNDVMPMIRAKRVGAACPHAVSTVHADLRADRTSPFP